MNYIYWLSQIKYSEQCLVGNKIFILSQLLQHECPILPGFVLGKNLFSQFLASTDNTASLRGNLLNSWLDLDVDNFKTLQSVANCSRQLVNQAVFPISWQQEIFQAAQQLNADSLLLHPVISIPYPQHQINRGFWRSYTCSNNSAAIAITIKRVWSELFTASSLLYWHKLELSWEKIGLAILVRPLKTAFASGSVELDSSLVRIKASWGLDLSLFQGDVEPDEYYVDRHTGLIISQHLGHKSYGYRPRTIVPTIPLVDCIEAYIPSETPSETSVLDQNAIAKLLHLTKLILAQQPQTRYLAWTALATEEQSAVMPQFYFTELSKIVARTTNTLSDKVTQIFHPSSLIQPLLTGVAASPGNVLGKVLVVEDLNHLSPSISHGCILVSKEITPQQISLIKHVGGIVTETGGTTSHGAIIARELNIPAIVNAVDATQILQTGVEVFLNGNEGKVYPATAQKQFSLTSLSMDSLFSPNYPIATKLMVNLSQPESIVPALNLPIDGVGLLRAELMLADFLVSQTLTQWQEQSCRDKFLAILTNYLRQFAAAFAPRPVYYRSIDWYGQDKFNPLLGNRGTYSYLADPTLFDLELEALATITAEKCGHVNLILPFVRSVEEFEFCYRRLENIGLTAEKSFQVWIMAEVPSVIFLLPEYITAGVQGISIGTNDLTQLLLGVDREQGHFGERGLNANHPAMQKAIAKLIKTAQDNNIDCCICGQAPVDYPELIEKLISWGITAFSVAPDAVERTHKAIARAERRLLLKSLKE